MSSYFLYVCLLESNSEEKGKVSVCATRMMLQRISDMCVNASCVCMRSALAYRKVTRKLSGRNSVDAAKWVKFLSTASCV